MVKTQCCMACVKKHYGVGQEAAKKKLQELLES
jgi:hypothetical protein